MANDTYQARANKFRPTDVLAMANAVRQLQAQGLKPRDIGQLLELDPEQVRQFMEGHENAG